MAPFYRGREWPTGLAALVVLFAMGCQGRLVAGEGVPAPPSDNPEVQSSTSDQSTGRTTEGGPNRRGAGGQAPSGEASAGGLASPFVAPEVVAATVKEVPAGEWTNGNPPKVVVQVDQVLRGQTRPGSRLTVVWGPRPHSIDYGDRKATIRAWEAQKTETPKVGEEWILWMSPDGQDMITPETARWPRNETNLATARATIAAQEKSDKEYAAAREKERNEYLDALRKWRAGVKDADIKRWAAEADLVAIGTLGGSGSFEVVEILKGQRRDSASSKRPYYVSAVFAEPIATLLADTRYWLVHDRYLLFLSDKGVDPTSRETTYQPVGDGVVIADEAALSAAREAIKEKPGNAKSQ